ncbi:MAG: type II toxin-antitoxin system VapC family toxin [Candidatus Korobacteraceae bacterium]
MSSVVLDASAILAVIVGEPGQEKLPPSVLTQAVISTVNLAEVQGKLEALGWTPDEAWEDATGLVREAIPFTEQQARTTGELLAQTRSLGLSLGDRACLALAMALNVPVYTADQTWKKLKLGIRIHLIR